MIDPVDSPALPIAEIFRQGLTHHQAGRLPDADACYRQVLTHAPTHAPILHLLGQVALQSGRNDAAVEYLTEAIGHEPSSAEYHSNLGNALAGLGRLPEAETCYREALRLQPAVPVTLNNLGNALRDQSRAAEAETYYRAALGLDATYVEAHNNLGNVLQDLDRLEEAQDCLSTAIGLKPDFTQAHLDLGRLLRKLGRLEDAAASFRTALGLMPDLLEARHTLGNVMRELGRLEDAASCYREVLRVDPTMARAHYNLAMMLHELGRPEEAEISFREALRLEPDMAVAHGSLAGALLLTGQFDEGWREYEWRWRGGFESFNWDRGFSQPQWVGEALGDRVLLLHAEQGFGDSLQFCRYAPLAAARGRVILEVPRPLVRLMTSLPGVEQVIAIGDPLPNFDLHCPLMSLPGAFGTTLDTIPGRTPYLAAASSQIEAWRRRVEVLPGLRVGIFWAGNPRLSAAGPNSVDRRRSIALSRFAPLADVAGVRFVSLQKGEAASQARPDGMVLHDWTDELDDFADTAALIETLDLVIGVDSAVLHLVGALGKPVWLLNRFDSCWRWLQHRTDSPWYPTLRQFRQPRPGDWDSVMTDLHAALENLASAP